MERGDPSSGLRHTVYAILITVAAGTMAGRILTASSDTGKTPFLNVNDRSRWCTIRALVDHGTFAIDEVTSEDEWRTIDMVRHRGDDGREHFYSSKPPLLPVLLAGEYWLLQKLTGVTLVTNPFLVGRLVLFFTNLLPMVLMLAVLARLVERYGRSDAGRLFVMTVAATATPLTLFASTLNNHLPATISVILALDATLRIASEGDRRWRWFLIAGFFSVFAATCEPLATLFTLAVTMLLMRLAPVRAAIAFLPIGAAVCAASLGTNWIAHGSLLPPYVHDSDGPVLLRIDPRLQTTLDEGRVPEDLIQRMPAEGVLLSDKTVIKISHPGSRWVVWDPEGEDRLAVVREGFSLCVRAWNDWYDYEGSYWKGDRAIIDRGEPSRMAYTFHLLIGHHGIFSLTPVWLLSAIGVWILIRRPSEPLGILAWLTAALACGALLLAVASPLQQRNYGGSTNGIRWTFWMIPLWLVVMLPAVDTIQERRGRRLAALVMLALSVMSVNYRTAKPWSHPWLYEHAVRRGWVSP